jgi:hypothetical protein
MSRTWKWIIGILIGLVVLAGISFVAANYFGFGHMAYFSRTPYAGHPMMDDYGFGDRAPRGGYQNFRHPMMGGRGFYPFGGFFFLGGLLRLIFPLAILAAVGYFAYRKGKQDGALEVVAVTPQADSPESEPEI